MWDNMWTVLGHMSIGSIVTLVISFLLDKRKYISNARFDKEFTIYQELLGKFSDMVVDNAKLFPQWLDREPSAEDKQKKFFIERYKKALQSYGLANRAIRVNAPFIKKEEIYDLFCKTKELCASQLRNYEIWYLNPEQDELRESLPVEQKTDKHKKCPEITKEIECKLDEIILEIRKYKY